MLLLAIPPFFLMHFREAKLPVHVHVERVVGGNSLPQILKEPKHLKHIDVLKNADSVSNVLLKVYYCINCVINVIANRLTHIRSL